LTDAEQLLWRHVRRKQICGMQFNRQKPLLDFIVDFYCAGARLVIELDGGQHLEPAHRGRDAARDEALTRAGFRVLRFDNRQVLLETDAVLAVIDRVVGERVGKSE